MQQANNAVSKDILNNILDAALAYAKTVLENLKNDVIAVIEALTSIAKSRIDGFIEDVNKALTRDVVNTIKEQAVNEDNYKQNAIDQINSLTNLSQSEKTGYINRIKQAAKNDTIDNILIEATNKQADNLLQMQKQATINSINTLTKLTAEEKNGFIERVNTATAITECYVILSEAETLDRGEGTGTGENNELEQQRQSIIDSILNYQKLTNEEKDSFVARVNAAKTNTEFYNISNEAYTLNSSRDTELLEGQRQAMINSLMTLTKLTDEEKNGFVERITAATSSTEFSTIFAEAYELNASRNETPGE